MHMTRTVGRAAAALTIGLAIAVLGAGCSGAEPQESPATVLTRAKAALDTTSSVHFTLTSQNVPAGNNRLVSGSGVASHPPAAFQGKLSILFGGATVSIEVISVGGVVYAKLPFSATFQKTDPAKFGLTDPAILVESGKGITRMLAETTEAKRGDDVRIGKEVAEQITGNVPGAVVDELLSDADPATPVRATFYIVKDTGQLRRADLTAPFHEKGTMSTYALTLDHYGEQVTISAPPT